MVRRPTPWPPPPPIGVASTDARAGELVDVTMLGETSTRVVSRHGPLHPTLRRRSCPRCGGSYMDVVSSCACRCHDCDTTFAVEFLELIDSHLATLRSRMPITDATTRSHLLEASQAVNVTLSEEDLDQIAETLANEQVDVPQLMASYGNARILNELSTRIREFDENRRQSRWRDYGGSTHVEEFDENRAQTADHEEALRMADEAVDLEPAENRMIHVCPRCRTMTLRAVGRDRYQCPHCSLRVTASELSFGRYSAGPLAEDVRHVVTPDEHWTKRPTPPPPDLRTRRLRTRKE